MLLVHALVPSLGGPGESREYLLGLVESSGPALDAAARARVESDLADFERLGHGGTLARLARLAQRLGQRGRRIVHTGRGGGSLLLRRLGMTLLDPDRHGLTTGPFPGKPVLPPPDRPGEATRLVFQAHTDATSEELAWALEEDGFRLRPRRRDLTGGPFIPKIMPHPFYSCGPYYCLPDNDDYLNLAPALPDKPDKVERLNTMLRFGVIPTPGEEADRLFPGAFVATVPGTVMGPHLRLKLHVLDGMDRWLEIGDGRGAIASPAALEVLAGDLAAASYRTRFPRVSRVFQRHVDRGWAGLPADLRERVLPGCWRPLYLEELIGLLGDFGGLPPAEAWEQLRLIRKTSRHQPARQARLLNTRIRSGFLAACRARGRGMGREKAVLERLLEICVLVRFSAPPKLKYLHRAWSLICWDRRARVCHPRTEGRMLTRAGLLDQRERKKAWYSTPGGGWSHPRHIGPGIPGGFRDGLPGPGLGP